MQLLGDVSGERAPPRIHSEHRLEFLFLLPGFAEVRESGDVIPLRAQGGPGALSRDPLGRATPGGPSKSEQRSSTLHDDPGHGRLLLSGDVFRNHRSSTTSDRPRAPPPAASEEYGHMLLSAFLG